MKDYEQNQQGTNENEYAQHLQGDGQGLKNEEIQPNMQTEYTQKWQDSQHFQQSCAPANTAYTTPENQGDNFAVQQTAYTETQPWQQAQSTQHENPGAAGYFENTPNPAYTAAQTPLPAGTVAYYIPEQKPEKKKGKSAAKILLIIVACFVAFGILSSLVLGMFVLVGFSSFGSGAGGFSMLSAPPTDSFSVIDVQGEISSTSYTYNHDATLSYIDSLIETENDKGILLFMNTPGGGVYEGDELYRALQRYREETGRPVWVYMGQICASAGYYISAAADNIMANPNTTTGSIGVYIALQDVSGLYDMLGIETVLIRSGDNKGTGIAGVPITEEQEAMYQAQVDEYFDNFVNAVATGRKMSYEQALTLSDGSIYTGNMALENGLVDELGDWDDLLARFEEELGATAYYPNLSELSYVNQVFGALQSIMPQSDAQAILSRMDSLPQGVPLSYAEELADLVQPIRLEESVR